VHVLTKIFVVLVSLLAVFLVPLVVVYAYNENNYKAKFQAAEAKAFTAQEALKAAEARAGSNETRLNTDLENYKNQVRELDKAKATAETSMRLLQSQLATTTNTQAGITTNIAQIRQALEAGQLLTESLVNEVRELRANAVAIERQKVELDEAVRDVTSQLEVAENARRALAEELARLKDRFGQGYCDGL
jgi:chromosome segregation ATPase